MRTEYSSDEYFFYEGVRSTALSLRIGGKSVRNAIRVAGTLAGSGVHPQPAQFYRTDLVALAPDGQAVGAGKVLTYMGGAASSAFDVELNWPASLGRSLLIKLYALQRKVTDNLVANGYTESFTGYGFKALTVSAGQNLAGQTLTLVPVTNRYVQFNASLPSPSLNATYATGYAKLAPDGPKFRYEGSNQADISSPPFSFLVPGGPGSSTDISLFLSNSAALSYSTQWLRQLAGDVGQLTFQPRLPVAIEAPAEGAVVAPKARLA